MSEQLEPWGERVLVAPDPAQRETTTGILIPATAQKKARRDRHGGLAMTRPGDRLTETLFLPNPDGSGHPQAFHERGATWSGQGGTHG